MTPRLLRLMAIAILAVAFAGTAAAQSVVVASKIDTEGGLLGNVIVLLLTKNDIPVESKVQLGPTNIVRSAILAGQIDIYPEYTGNGATFFKRETDPIWKDADGGYATVKAADLTANHLVWLKPAPANNTWAIAVRSDLAGPEKLRSLQDFARYVNDGGKLKLAGSAEFVETPGGLPSFQKMYGFTLKQDQLLVLSGGDTAATMHAAAEGVSGVNAAMTYGTDGALSALHLTVMGDDKGAQVVYEPAPVVREAVLHRYPKIAALLDPVFASLTLETLQSLNAKIAVDGENAKTVAGDYLAAKGFLK